MNKLVTAFNNYRKLYEYPKDISVEKELKCFNHFVIKDDTDFLGLCIITSNQLNSEFSIQFFSYYTDVDLSSNFILKALDFFNNVSLKYYGYFNFETVVSCEEHAEILKNFLGASIHKITNKYFICYKELKYEIL